VAWEAFPWLRLMERREVCLDPTHWWTSANSCQTTATDEITYMSPVPVDLPTRPHFIIRSMPDGVITVDGQMRLTDLNRAAEKLTGYRREEALERFCGSAIRGRDSLAG